MEKVSPAERVGFEPTRPCGQTVFKTASLWPLRYLSMFASRGISRPAQKLFYQKRKCVSTTFFRNFSEIFPGVFFGWFPAFFLCFWPCCFISSAAFSQLWNTFFLLFHNFQNIHQNIWAGIYLSKQPAGKPEGYRLKSICTNFFPLGSMYSKEFRGK